MELILTNSPKTHLSYVDFYTLASPQAKDIDWKKFEPRKADHYIEGRYCFTQGKVRKMTIVDISPIQLQGRIRSELAQNAYSFDVNNFDNLDDSLDPIKTLSEFEQALHLLSIVLRSETGQETTIIDGIERMWPQYAIEEQGNKDWLKAMGVDQELVSVLQYSSPREIPNNLKKRIQGMYNFTSSSIS